MKNYTLLSFIILVLFSLNSYSQNFAPIGATWHYTANNSEPPWDVNYILIESIKDTIVLGKSAQKLNITHYSASGGTSSSGFDVIYSDSNKVYLYRYNQFHLLYNFNANQGDTIYMIEPISWGGCGGNNDTLIEVFVDSVRMENIGGAMKKVQYVSNLEFGWSIGSKFIESVGSDLYFSPIYCTFPPEFGPLRCYSDSLVNYQLVPDCEELVVGVKEDMNRENKYTIPTVVYEYLQLPILHGDLFIYDLQGKIIKNEKIKSFINLENMNQGIYILILKNDELFIQQKLIKF